MAKLKSSSKKKTAGSAPKSGTARLQSKAEGLSKSIVDSAQQIWLAGMGAFGRAQQEGTKLFETLVSEGVSLEKTTRKLASGKAEIVRGVVENSVGQVKERAADTWDRLEKVFEERVQRALNRLGVPSSDDLQNLIKRVDQLNGELRKLGNAPAAHKSPAKPAAKKAAAKKAPSKKAVARKPAAKKSAAKTISDATE